MNLLLLDLHRESITKSAGLCILRTSSVVSNALEERFIEFDLLTAPPDELLEVDHVEHVYVPKLFTYHLCCFKI